MESCNTKSSLDLPLESLSLQPFLQSLHKEQWQEVRLGEVAEIIGGGTPKTSIPEYWNGEIPWLTPKDLAGYNHIYISKGERFITELGLKNSSATLMPKGAILLSSRAPIGYVAIAQNDICTNQGFKSLVVEPKQACNLFVYYWIKNNVEYLQSLGTGTTFEEISKSVVQDITIPLPPLTIQQKIAEILSSFDDKIDLLHRQNKTLESLALTLFRHYFIDNPKRDEWEEKPLSEVAYFLNGLACQKLPPRNDKDRLPVLKIKELKEGISQASDWATSEIDSQYIVENGDVIFAWSASLMVKMWNGSRCVLNQHLFKVTSQVYPKWFYYFWCKYHLQDFIAIANAHATTMGHIKRQDLDLAMCVIPDTQSLQTIDKEIAPLLQKININAKQIQNLQAMRDMLLKAIFA